MSTARRLAAPLAPLALAALVAAPRAEAALRTTLLLEPESALTLAGSAPTPLSGSLALAFADFPLAGPTAVDVVDLALAADPLAITLDPAIATPGLGVAGGDGSYLVPTLFVVVDDGDEATALAIPDVTGFLDASDPGLLILNAVFDVDSPQGVVTVSIVAAPEPGATGGAAAAGLAALAARRRYPGGRAASTCCQRSGSGWPSRSRKISRKR